MGLVGYLEKATNKQSKIHGAPDIGRLTKGERTNLHVSLMDGLTRGANVCVFSWKTETRKVPYILLLFTAVYWYDGIGVTISQQTTL